MKDVSKDDQIRQVLESQLGEHSPVERLFVQGELLQVHVKKEFYIRLASDRDLGRKFVLALMKNMKRLASLDDVTVWVYCQKEKMIEGKVKAWGGDNVLYLNDL